MAKVKKWVCCHCGETVSISYYRHRKVCRARKAAPIRAEAVVGSPVDGAAALVQGLDHLIDSRVAARFATIDGRIEAVLDARLAKLAEALEAAAKS